MSNDDFIKLSLKDYNEYIENYNLRVLHDLDLYNCGRLTDFTKDNLNNLDNNILEKLEYSYYDNFVKYDGCPIGSDELEKFIPNNCKCKNGLKCDFNDRDCKSSVCPFKIKNLKDNKIQNIKDEQNKQSRFIRKDIMNICVSIFGNSGIATVQYKNKHLEVKDFDLDINSLKLSFLIDRDKFKHSIGDKVEELNFEYSRDLMVLQNGDIIDISDVTYQSNDNIIYINDDIIHINNGVYQYQSSEKYKRVVILFKSLDAVGHKIL